MPKAGQNLKKIVHSELSGLSVKAEAGSDEIKPLNNTSTQTDHDVE
jgi:hypothetical protein